MGNFYFRIMAHPGSLSPVGENTGTSFPRQTAARMRTVTDAWKCYSTVKCQNLVQGFCLVFTVRLLL